MSKEELSKKVSDYLYGYLDGKGQELPLDEFDNEAHEIVSKAKAGAKPLQSNEMTVLVRNVLSLSLDHEYDIDSLSRAGEDLVEIIY